MPVCVDRAPQMRATAHSTTDSYAFRDCHEPGRFMALSWRDADSNGNFLTVGNQRARSMQPLGVETHPQAARDGRERTSIAEAEWPEKSTRRDLAVRAIPFRRSQLSQNTLLRVCSGIIHSEAFAWKLGLA